MTIWLYTLPVIPVLEFGLLILVFLVGAFDWKLGMDLKAFYFRWIHWMWCLILFPLGVLVWVIVEEAYGTEARAYYRSYRAARENGTIDPREPDIRWRFYDSHKRPQTLPHTYRSVGALNETPRTPRPETYMICKCGARYKVGPRNDLANYIVNPQFMPLACPWCHQIWGVEGVSYKFETLAHPAHNYPKGSAERYLY